MIFSSPTRVKLAVAGALTMVMAGALAADKPVPESRPAADDLSTSHRDINSTKVQPAEPGKEWWRTVVARFPNCATLTDGCQSCVPNGETLTCSNPGIACARTEWRCSAEKAENKPEPPKDGKSTPKQ